MVSRLDILRRVVKNHLLSSEINWEQLPANIIDAARVRGDFEVRPEFIHEVVNGFRRGEIKVDGTTFPNGTPSLLKLYVLALKKQIANDR